MNTLEQILDIADEQGLSIIETTSEGNGYPKELRKAIIGFDSFEDAKTFAKKYNLSVMMFFQRNGWQLWHRRDIAYEPIKVSASDYGDDYRELTVADMDSYFEDEVKTCLDNFEDFDSIEIFLDEQKEIYNELKYLNESEKIITYQGRYYETVSIESMDWSYDSKRWIIGVDCKFN